MKIIIKTILFSLSIAQICFAAELPREREYHLSRAKSNFNDILSLYNSFDMAKKQFDLCKAAEEEVKKESQNLVFEIKKEIWNCFALSHEQVKEKVLSLQKEFSLFEKESALKSSKELKGKDIIFNGEVLISKDISLKKGHYKLMAHIMAKYPHKKEESSKKLTKLQEDTKNAETLYIIAEAGTLKLLKPFVQNNLSIKLDNYDQEKFKSILSIFMG